MGFTVEDGHLIKFLRASKGYEATRLCQVFPERQWNANRVNNLMKKNDMTRGIDRQRQRGHWSSTQCIYASQHQFPFFSFL